MADGHNHLFRRDPWAYVQDPYHLVMLHNLPSLIWGTYQLQNEPRKILASTALLAMLDADKTVGVDLTPLRAGWELWADNVLFRPCFKAEWMARTRLNSYPPNLAQHHLALGRLPADPEDDPPVQGYWAPYLTTPVQSINDLGYVDVPKRNVAYSFIFTGAMNGCHLVVARCPDISKRLTHFRVYHYQSPSRQHPILPSQAQRAQRHFVDPHFGEVYFWLDSSDYCGNDVRENTAFNFLYKPGPGRHWRIVCQPKKVSLSRENPRHERSSVAPWEAEVPIPNVD